MGFIAFIKTFGFILVVCLVLFSLIGRLFSWVKSHRWTSRLIILLLSVSIAYYLGLQAVFSLAESTMTNLKINPDNSIDRGYFIGDFLPTLNALKGPISPEMWNQVRLISQQASPCHSAMAKKFLGENVDVDVACRASS